MTEEPIALRCSDPELKKSLLRDLMVDSTALKQSLLAWYSSTNLDRETIPAENLGESSSVRQ